MKFSNKIYLSAAIAALLTGGTSCKKLLEESPRSELYPSYFSTAGGIKAGITGVYNALRGFHQGEGIAYVYMGTDESIAGGSANPAYQQLNSYNGINSSITVDQLNLYTNINTLNGVLQYAQASDLPAATKTQYIAQAKFLRAWIYFQLVQTYGGTTATQKSGIPLHTTFITEATTADAPAPLADIYNLIIQDLTDAAQGLPALVNASNLLSAQGKTATAGVAKAYLAKVYLTRGYLTEVAQPGDFQKSADLTAELITNKSTYGLDLFQDYNDVVKQANDYGKETMFAIDFGITDPAYSGYTQQGTGGYGLNNIPVLHRWDYIGNAGIDNSPGIDAVPIRINTANKPMVRDVYNGRPYIRVAPNAPYTVQVAFADQVHDTRWDATFQTFWICNKAGVPAGLKSDGTRKGVLVPTTSNSMNSYVPPANGDTAILMPGTEVTMARRDDFKGMIVTPRQYNNNIFPVVKKFDDNLRAAMNDFSSRPVVVMRFSEVYLMNAEANYMLGNYGAAATQLNVLRERAAYRTPADAQFIPKGQFRVTAASMAADNAANAAAMRLTPAQIAQLSIPTTTSGTNLTGMDLILEEYTREFYGDPRRWYDLVRTRQLVRRVKMYNALGAPNVQEIHMRRPIPQNYINTVSSGPKYPQNNGYN
jgi:hypothetical protein